MRITIYYPDGRIKNLMTHREITYSGFDKCNIPPGGRLLDVGCGGQECRKSLEDRGFIWHGLDKRPGNDYECLMENMVPVPSDYFDVVFACHSFEHCEHPLEAIAEFARVCKQDGYIFISTPVWCLHQVINADEDHLFVLPKENFQRLMKYVGFKKENIQSFDEMDGDNVQGSSTITCVKVDKTQITRREMIKKIIVGGN